MQKKKKKCKSKQVNLEEYHTELICMAYTT